MNDGFTLSCQLISVASIIVNVYLLYVYYVCPVKVVKSYKYFFLLTALQDILYSSCMILLVPVMVSSDYAVILVATGPLHKGITGQILIHLFIAVFMSCMLLMTNSFIYRYAQVCKPHFSEVYCSNHGTVKGVIINAALMSNWIVIVYVVYSPNALFIEHHGGTVQSVTGIRLSESAGVGLSIKYSILNSISMCLVGEIVIVTFLLGFIMAYCAVKIWTTLRKATISSNLRHMHRQMLTLLLLQTACPALFLQSPVLSGYIHAFGGLRMSISVIYLHTILLSLFPLTSPVIIIGFLSGYRRHTLAKLGLCNRIIQEPLKSLFMSDTRKVQQQF